jgi:hypothetical protein
MWMKINYIEKAAEKLADLSTYQNKFTRKQKAIEAIKLILEEIKQKPEKTEDHLEADWMLD